MKLTNCLIVSIIVWWRLGYPIQVSWGKYFPWVHFYNVVKVTPGPNKVEFEYVISVKPSNEGRDLLLFFEPKLTRARFIIRD